MDAERKVHLLDIRGELGEVSSLVRGALERAGEAGDGKASWALSEALRGLELVDDCLRLAGREDGVEAA